MTPCRVLGGRWAVHVLRDLVHGRHRFSDMLASTLILLASGAPRETCFLELAEISSSSSRRACGDWSPGPCGPTSSTCPARDLTRLVSVRPEIIKLDRGLITGCSADPMRMDVVRGMLLIARASGAQVCAEGVETASDLEALTLLGVDLAQGYHLGRPTGRWHETHLRPDLAPATTARPARLPSPRG